MLRLIPLQVGHVRITILWLAHINIDKRDFDSEVVLPTKYYIITTLIETDE